MWMKLIKENINEKIENEAHEREQELRKMRHQS